jgi:hypothetical protein
VRSGVCEGEINKNLLKNDKIVDSLPELLKMTKNPVNMLFCRVPIRKLYKNNSSTEGKV